MSDQNENKENNTEQPNELELLKQRATIMNIQFHPSIGIDKLKEKIAEKQAGGDDESKEDGTVEDGEEGVSLGNATAAQLQEQLATIQESENAAKLDVFTPMQRDTPSQILNRKKKDALRLVRIRVTNMNPIKGSLQGELLSVGNSQIGFIKKYIPFNADQGWHVPQILLNELKARRYMAHFTIKDDKGKKVNKNKLVPEFAIEIMAPLTEKELNELKQRQIMAASGNS